MSKTIYHIEVDDSMIDNLAGGFCYGKSRFGIQEDDKREFIRKAMERFANKNMGAFVHSEYINRKIDQKPDLQPITVTMEEIK